MNLVDVLNAAQMALQHSPTKDEQVSFFTRQLSNLAVSDSIFKVVREHTLEEAAQVCAGRADQWHQQFWQAHGSDFDPQQFSRLRDEAVECKKRIRALIHVSGAEVA